MNGPESKFYGTLKRKLAPCPIVMKRVENTVDTGTPDVNFASQDNEGWIELKVIPKMPKRLQTKIKIPFRPGQYAWVMGRLGINNKTSNYLVVQIEEMIFIFKNYRIQEEYTVKELIAFATFQETLRTASGTRIFNVLNQKEK